MKYGITGNTDKEKLWHPAAELVHWLRDESIPFCLHQRVADGLAARGLVEAQLCQAHSEQDLAAAVDVIFSFGGDGTLLNSAHEVGARGTPILGVNIGRLGFLADVEVGHIKEAVELLERGEYRTERRLALSADVSDGMRLATDWAFNEFVIERSGSAKLISIDVSVDSVHLNTYWADGLIIATPTGSTAYSLSTGGPIMVPGCGAIIITPIAPHTLTVRPIVLPDASVIEARVMTKHPYVLAADGFSTLITQPSIGITIRRAEHTVNLIKFPRQHFFKTIRSKLMWGVRNHEY